MLHLQFHLPFVNPIFFNYIIENKIITNVENEEDFIELFNKKLATIILNLENELRGCNSNLSAL